MKPILLMLLLGLSADAASVSLPSNNTIPVSSNSVPITIISATNDVQIAGFSGVTAGKTNGCEIVVSNNFSSVVRVFLPTNATYVGFGSTNVLHILPGDYGWALVTIANGFTNIVCDVNGGPAQLVTIPGWHFNFVQTVDARTITLGGLIISGTTNQLVFSSTNSAPANTNAVKWVSVQLVGDTNAYRLPLSK